MSNRIIKNEKETITVMIRMYCRHHHGNSPLCQNCGTLLEYALLRIDKCKFGDKKPVCNACPVHCYKPEMRERVRQVMRWSGPRMVYTHPVLAIKHLLQKKKNIPG